MSQLLPAHPDIEATIVGEGDALESLRERAAREELPIRFLGAIHDSNELEGVFENATLVVAPAAIGLLAVDALQYGVPVVYPDSPMRNGPETEALTEGVNALSFDPTTPDALASAVEEWLHKMSDVDVDSFVSSVREALDLWSAANVARSIQDAIFDEV
ncbi:hypothetical protein GCM10027416_08060 [Okibacterium endophyticum]